MKVAIFYHFIAHYRKEVFQELQKKGDYHYYADNYDYMSQGIRGVGEGELENFHEARCVRVFNKFMWQKGVLSASLSSDYDVLVYLANPYYLSTWISALCARIIGKKVFFWTIGWHRPFLPFRDLVKIIFYFIPNGFLLYNKRNQELLKRVPFLSRKEMFVVYNSISGSSVSNLSAQENITKLEPGYLICVSRLESKRGIDKIIDSMKLLRDDSGVELELLLVGDGSERYHLESYSKELGVKVQFWGASYDKNELSKLYSCASVTVAPSMVGLTAIQSMLHGVPVITHSDYSYQAPESEAIIDNETGFLFTRDNLQDLTRAIKQAIDMFSSPEERLRIRNNCHSEVLERWSPEAQSWRIHDAVGK